MYGARRAARGVQGMRQRGVGKGGGGGAHNAVCSVPRSAPRPRHWLWHGSTRRSRAQRELDGQQGRQRPRGSSGKSARPPAANTCWDLSNSHYSWTWTVYHQDGMPNLGLCFTFKFGNSKRVGGWASDTQRREQQNCHGPPRARPRGSRALLRCFAGRPARAAG